MDQQLSAFIPYQTITARRKFTIEEDERLRELVNKYGARRWRTIAQYMPGRSAKQCRDRYCDYLNPNYFNGEWSPEEDRLLLEKYREIGSQWSKMTQFFENRNANNLKNRWNSFTQRKGFDINKVLSKDEKDYANFAIPSNDLKLALPPIETITEKIPTQTIHYVDTISCLLGSLQKAS